MRAKKEDSMARTRVLVLMALLGLAAVAFLVLGLDSNEADPVSMQAEAPPQEVEITDYQGVALGSIEDFRENSIRGVQEIDPATYRLVVDGLVSQSASFTLDELATFDRAEKLVTLHCVEGWSVQALWEGIRLGDLLDQVSPAEEANTVIFHASDGYTTSLSLITVHTRNLIIADRINDITLPAELGYPFQLVAEDKWGYKWIRWLTRIELSDDPEYQGFWESRGFNNIGDTDGPIMDGFLERE